MKKLVLVVAVLLAAALAPATQAACSDPLSSSEPLVWRSPSGIEVEWYVDVKPGCSATLRVVNFRDTGPAEDVRSAQTYASPILPAFGPGTYSFNTLSTSESPYFAVLYAGGSVYRILPVDPAAVE